MLRLASVIFGSVGTVIYYFFISISACLLHSGAILYLVLRYYDAESLRFIYLQLMFAQVTLSLDLIK